MKLEARVKNIIHIDGLEFVDLNSDGILNPYEDWRLPAQERADNLVSLMNVDEKIGMLFINSRSTGMNAPNKENTSFEGYLDENVTGYENTIFSRIAKVYPTTEIVKEMNLRRFILRENCNPYDLARWMNALNELAESTRLAIPVLVTSNSRNERGETTFGMNDAVGVFSTWPGTLGLAAAAKGDIKRGEEARIISEFGAIAVKEWRACGLRKGYMYMADVMSDPRWQRSYGTFGEDPEFVSDAITRLIKEFQGDELNSDSVALTIKHFPGGGARENGFDPHYDEGKWNVYPTKGSLEKYHMPPFEAAVKYKASSIMPYYSIPSTEKSEKQEYNGKVIDFEEVGFAFNKEFIDNILRKQMGFEGYINSDSGILDNMAWGVKDMGKPQRFAKAMHAGVDVFADTNEISVAKEAYEKGLINDNDLNIACNRLLVEMFKLGIFDDKRYVDPELAEEVVRTKEHWEKAYEAHQKSTVLLKNTNGILPLTKDKLVGKKIYVEAFHQKTDMAEEYTKELVEVISSFDTVELTDDYKIADIAIIMNYPKSGNYFNATTGLLELELVENKKNKSIDALSEYEETTLSSLNKIRDISSNLHSRGKVVISSINFIMPWIVSNIEEISDVLIASFDTLPKAQLDVVFGLYNPTGVLPITLPASEKVIEVIDGICISPNDVPGYDKSKYMPNGMEYAYKDLDGNEYKLNYGLSY